MKFILGAMLGIVVATSHASAEIYRFEWSLGNGHQARIDKPRGSGSFLNEANAICWPALIQSHENRPDFNAAVELTGNPGDPPETRHWYVDGNNNTETIVAYCRVAAPMEKHPQMYPLLKRDVATIDGPIPNLDRGHDRLKVWNALNAAARQMCSDFGLVFRSLWSSEVGPISVGPSCTTSAGVDWCYLRDSRGNDVALDHAGRLKIGHVLCQ